MKKILFGICIIFAAAIVSQAVLAAAYPPGLGGTGTTAVPSSGQLLIGNGAGTYTPSTLTSGTGINITNASGSITIGNTGVTSLSGSGCVSVPNATGTVSLTVSCISGNQNIVFTLSGDATGTANGTTAITDTITVIGLNGKSLPANTTGTLQYSGGAWSINLATSSLGLYNANGVLSSYAGSACGGGQYVSSISAAGVVTCGTLPISGVGPSTSTYLGVFNASNTLVGYAALSYNSSTNTFAFSGPTYPLVTITNGTTTQYNGAGIQLLNPAALGNQGGAEFFAGVNNASGTQGYASIDQVNSSGTYQNHLLVFNYNSSTATFYPTYVVVGQHEYLSEDGYEGLMLQSDGNTGNGEQTLMNIVAPYADPQEADLSLIRVNASGTGYGWDFSNQCYGTATSSVTPCTNGVPNYDEIQWINTSTIPFETMRTGFWTNYNSLSEQSNTIWAFQLNTSSAEFGNYAPNSYAVNNQFQILTPSTQNHAFEIDETNPQSSTFYIAPSGATTIGNGLTVYVSSTPPNGQYFFINNNSIGGAEIGAYSGGFQSLYIDSKPLDIGYRSTGESVNLGTVTSTVPLTVYGNITQSSGTVSLASTTIAGNATTTNLSITALGSAGSPCLDVATNGAVATTTCSGVGSLTGTAGQVQVSNSTGSVTLSAPQNINTTSSPTFNNLNASGTINASTSITIAGVAVATSTASGANPTASVGTSAVNGSSANFMRADAAPAINQGAAFSFSNLGNTTSTLNISANTFTSNSTSSSWLYNFDGNIYIPSPSILAAGITCGSATSVTALDTCVNDWYTYLSTVASSTNFYLSKGVYPMTDTTGFNFQTSGERASLYGVGGQGTQINDTAATGTIGTIGWGTGTAAGAVIQGISFYGANTNNANTSSTGNIGWVVNSPYITFRDDWWSQGSIQVYLNTNTYLDTFDNDYFSYAGYKELYAPNSSNSGESNSIMNTSFATPGNSTTSACVYLNTESTNISAHSIDGCQLEVGGLAHVSVSGVHFETISANSIYGAEIPIKVDAGGVLTLINDDFMNDGIGASSTPEFILNAGGHVHSQNSTLWANPSSTANFIVNTNGGTFDSQGTDISNSTGTIPAPTSTFTASCGTAYGVVNGNQLWGSVTFTTSSMNCTITFPTAFVHTPACFVINATSSANIIRSQTITTTTDLFADTSNFPTSSIENFSCNGLPN